jgi:hypothetical protein
VVQESRWTNPHSVIRLATRAPNGKAITLEIEGGPPAVLRTGGVTATSITKGDRVTVVVSPSRRFPETSAYGHEVIKADGTVVPLAAPGLRTPPIAQRATALWGTWVPTAEFFAEMRALAREARLTEKGSRIREGWTQLSSTQANCVPMTAPMLMTYPVAVEFSREAQGIAIRSDWMGAERHIQLDARSQPPAVPELRQGRSTGRWDGATLVVESTGFADEVWAGMPTGPRKHLLERFQVAEDGRSLRYSFELRDPDHLAQPVTGSGLLTYRPDLKVGGQECDREAARRYFRELQQ